MLGSGSLHYTIEEWKLNVMVEDDMIDLYRSLVPKHIKLNRTRFPGHITVIRNESVVNKEAWGKYEGQEIEFEYGEIDCGNVYFWLPVYCNRLTEIREELSLPASSEWSRPPNGKECFHITIGNLK